jgi:hypothetical protein
LFFAGIAFSQAVRQEPLGKSTVVVMMMAMMMAMVVTAMMVMPTMMPVMLPSPMHLGGL